MSRIYQEYFNEREKNPLYQISMTVGHQLRDQYSELNYDGQLAEKNLSCRILILSRV